VETAAAMKAARRGEMVTGGSPEDRRASLNKNHEYIAKFKRRYNRKRAGWYRAKLDESLLEVAARRLQASLPPRNHDHPLSGNWNVPGDCDVKPNQVFIARKPDTGILE